MQFAAKHSQFSSVVIGFEKLTLVEHINDNPGDRIEFCTRDYQVIMPMPTGKTNWRVARACGLVTKLNRFYHVSYILPQLLLAITCQFNIVF